MGEKILIAVIITVLCMQLGCGNTGTNSTTGQTGTQAQDSPNQAQTQSVQQSQNNKVEVYVTNVYNSLKYIAGNFKDSAQAASIGTVAPLENTTALGFILADTCRFYNYGGEQIDFSELSKAVKDYTVNNPKGMLCELEYNGNEVVSVKISDKAADISNSVTIQPTLHSCMN